MSFYRILYKHENCLHACYSIFVSYRKEAPSQCPNKDKLQLNAITVSQSLQD